MIQIPRTLFLASVLLLSVNGATWARSADSNAPQRPVIEVRDDLPRHSYNLDISVTALYETQNRGKLLALARQVAADTKADLKNYDIRDDNTVQEFYGLLGSVALLENDWQAYLDYLEKRKALESKEANRLTMGLAGSAVALTQLSDSPSQETFADTFQALVSALPYKTVEPNLKSLKGSTEILSRALVLGSLESNYQPVLDRNNGEISYDIAASLVGASFTFDHFLAVTDTINGILSDTIESNTIEKTDIWAQRQVTLDAKDKGTPVTLAVWDSGVDTDIFQRSGQLWINNKEIPDNGVDDDDNGFIDDVHGIAYDVDANKTTEILYPIGEFSKDEAELQLLIKGIGDIQFNVDSEEAGEVRRQLSSLPQDEVKTFLESLSIYGNYSHGTHVAGLAAEGNPFARLLVTRMTYGHEIIPKRPTLAAAHREAAMFLEVAEYFRSQGVRVVNMSWGGSLRSIEDALEANAAGKTPEERKALAREIFEIGDRALRRAISESQDILFVTSSGNSDNDVRFDEFYPSSYEYPNLLTVGAVDSAGDETSFTSLGNVDVYGNGYEVESYVPGGNRIPYNGTSMSSPQVMNLAGKLLALHPDLTVQELKTLIIDGAEEKDIPSRSIRLIDPKRSMELASKR
ncbi:S8 family serine peptidase [Congregibacter litoralis]|uniref:Subtilisin-like serine protease n=1 Tax=Congregibacter litoralis KT71 TaxID=314285 RepID=A4A419_9GAMM|nr:S8 family serine peptidase [Congregibacter litoralis]EAQ99442.1 Subtilisin-like serine protease [Congregibacter litoralis KT71]